MTDQQSEISYRQLEFAILVSDYLIRYMSSPLELRWYLIVIGGFRMARKLYSDDYVLKLLKRLMSIRAFVWTSLLKSGPKRC